MRKKVLITGAVGVIGTVLRKHLKEYELTLVDIKPIHSPNFYQLDLAKEYKRFKEILNGHDAVIHLAWNTEEDITSAVALPENKSMIKNVYKAALEVEPHPRVIMASSVHAAGVDWKKEPYCFIAREDYGKLPKKLLLIEIDSQNPDSPYGETKLWMEDISRKYAERGLKVICIRFGGINAADTSDVGVPSYDSIYLSHRDCTQFVRLCIEKDLPNFSIFYATSNNKYKVYDLSPAIEMLGYRPMDNT